MSYIPQLPPQGDPFWTVFTWRSDHVTLKRMRPVIEELIVLADTPCLVFDKGQGTCLDLIDVPPPCLACRLKQLRARLFQASGETLP